MSAQRNRPLRPAEPTPIDSGAVENLRYIRSTIEAAHTFTTVSGKGCIAMGLTGLGAVGLESMPRLAPFWLQIWLGAAIVACGVALAFMQRKARAQGLSLRTAVARRFFLTLTPAFLVGGILTAALVGDVGRNVITGVWLSLYGSGIAACGLFAIPAVLFAGIGFMAFGTAALWLPAEWAPAILAVAFGGIHIALGVIIARNHGG
jgi:hypothetical protein